MSKLQNHKSDIVKNRMLSVQMNLLNKCTSRCVYCKKYEWPDCELPFDKVKETIQYLRNEGLQSIVFSGGDPILYSNLELLLAYCKMFEIKTSIITTLLTYDTSLLDVIAVYCDRITVSVDSSKAETYKALRGVNGLNLALSNIKYVNEKRKRCGLEPIRFSSTVSINNVDEMYDLFDLAKSTGSKINFYLVHTAEEHMLKDDSKFYDNAKDIAALDVNGISNCHTLNKADTEITSQYCRLCSIHAIIDSNGDVYPCCHLLNDNGPYEDQNKFAYGNILTDAIKTVFEKRKTLKYDVENDCKGCVGRYETLVDELNEIFNEGNDTLWL